MSRRDAESVITDWLEDAPSSLPADARQGMLRRILATPQARTWRRWLPVRHHAAPRAAWIATATGLVLLLAGVIVVPDAGAPLGPGSKLAESQSPDGVRHVMPASRFRRGFEYDMPGGELPMQVLSGSLVSYDAGEFQVSVWLPVEVPVDPCDAGGLHRPVPGEDFVAYLRRVPGLAVGPPTQRYVDDILATEVRLLAAEDRQCLALAYLVDPVSGTTAIMGREEEARLTILEVDGRLMVFVAASRRGLDPWLPEIDAFLASVDFLPPY